MKQKNDPIIKTVKQQLKEELRTAISERKRLLELRNRSDLSKNDKLALAFGTHPPSLASSLIKGRSETDLKNYLDPNTATNVSSLLNAQSNDYSFLNKNSFIDENLQLLDNANSPNQEEFNKVTSHSLPGLDFKFNSKLDRDFNPNFIQNFNTNYNDFGLKHQKSLDAYLNDSSFSKANKLSRPNFYTNQTLTKTTNTYINSPTNLLNTNLPTYLTFSNSFGNNRLETSLSNKIDFSLKESKIQDLYDPATRFHRASTSLSYSLDPNQLSNYQLNSNRNKLSTKHLNFRSQFKPYSTADRPYLYDSKDRWKDYDKNDFLDLDFKTTKLNSLDSMQENKPGQSSLILNENYDDFINQPLNGLYENQENHDGKNCLFE